MTLDELAMALPGRTIQIRREKDGLWSGGIEGLPGEGRSHAAFHYASSAGVIDTLADMAKELMIANSGEGRTVPIQRTTIDGLFDEGEGV